MNEWINTQHSKWNNWKKEEYFWNQPRGSTNKNKGPDSILQASYLEYSLIVLLKEENEKGSHTVASRSYTFKAK